MSRIRARLIDWCCTELPLYIPYSRGPPLLYTAMLHFNHTELQQLEYIITQFINFHDRPQCGPSSEILHYHPRTGHYSIFCLLLDYHLVFIPRMSEPKAPDTPRRSARISLRREHATLVSPPELPPADINTTKQQSTGGIVVTTVALPLYEQPVPCKIRYFRQYRDPLPLRQINELVMGLVVNPFQLHSVGYVYCFTHPDDHDIDDSLGPAVMTAIHLVKIGRARRVPKRMKEWRAKCGYQPVTRFSHRMPEHERIEAIVHAQLYNERRKQYLGCSRCGSRHDEWFAVGLEHAEHLVRLWQGFTEHPIHPYDASGSLVPQWRQRLQNASMDDENCWTWFTRWEPASPAGSQAQGTEAP